MPVKKYKIEDLMINSESFWQVTSKAEQRKAFNFSQKYKEFITQNKIEKEIISFAIRMLKANGFNELNLDEPLGNKRKVFFVNRDKSLIALDLKDNFDGALNFLLSHVDSPRLDSKVKPLYEDGGLAYFKSHYYGGIKKYHWPAIPLELRGEVILKDGKKVLLHIGTAKDDPLFTISDLLPHLEKERMDKPFKEAIAGEELNVLVGSRAVSDKKIKNRVKAYTVKWLYENYGIQEKDLLSADLRFVPAFEGRDIGFDASLVGAYGQDDRVCVYTTLFAFLDAKGKKNNLLYLADKEEVGNVGATGVDSLWLENILNYLIQQLGLKVSQYDIFRKSKAISADVTAAYDPDYKSAFDETNKIELGHGLVIEKFLGHKGKVLSVDAEPEYLRYLMNIFDKGKVVWQTGHLGKIDQGGGGTVASHLAMRNLEIVDIGVPLLNMHAPYEVVSKGDIYSAYKGYKVFLEN